MRASPRRLVIVMGNESQPIRRVAVLTLGCKLNQADSEAIARDLLAAGCEVTDRPAVADGFVINTCAVTHVADRKARHLARLARRLSPEGPVIVTGCGVESGGPALSAAVGSAVVLGNHEKSSAAARLLAAWPAGPLGVPSGGSVDRQDFLRTRAFVRVQEGCNDVCAFCVVPRTRGRERSVPIEEVVSAVQAREREGVQEVVLTGTQIGAYRGNAADGSGPAVLLRALLAGATVPRLRLSSLQPQDITRELLSLWESPRLCRHFHLALQSGSDAVLARMRRRYTVEGFRRAVALIRDHLPDAAITTDVMAGFPGESDADFLRTWDFCREARFARLHVFPYSPRPGTSAARMGDQVPESVKRARTQRLLSLARDLRTDFEARHEGRVMPVLWERDRPVEDGTVWEGLTDNYMRVLTRSDANLRNRVLSARIASHAHSAGEPGWPAQGIREEGLWGELV